MTPMSNRQVHQKMKRHRKTEDENRRRRSTGFLQTRNGDATGVLVNDRLDDLLIKLSPELTTLRHFHLAASFAYLLVILATPLRYTAAALTTGGANGSAATTSSTLRSDAALTAAAMAALLPAAGPDGRLRRRAPSIDQSPSPPRASRLARPARRAARVQRRGASFGDGGARSPDRPFRILARLPLGQTRESRPPPPRGARTRARFGDRPHIASGYRRLSRRGPRGPARGAPREGPPARAGP